MAEWQDIASAPEGVVVRVAHTKDPFSQRENRFFDTTGVKQDGKWQCNAGFVCIDGMLRFDPDLWLPTPPETTA
jgi:hypothetical protein